MKTRLLTATCLTLSLALSAGEPTPLWWAALPVDQLGRLEGTCAVQQQSGGRKNFELKFDTKLDYLVREAEAPGKREVFLARRMTIDASENRSFLSDGGGLEILQLDDTGELKRGQAGFQLPALLESYLPMEAIFPALALPDQDSAPTEWEERGEIHVFGTDYEMELKVRLEREAAPSGNGRLKIYRDLRAPPEGVEIKAGKQRLREWRDSYHLAFDATGWRLEALGRFFRVSMARSSSTYDVTHDLRLRAREVRPLEPGESRFFTSFQPELRFLLGGLRLSFAGTGANAVKQRADKLASQFSDSAFAGFAEALVSGVEYRVKERPRPEPRKQASVVSGPRVRIGEPAPDFVLEGMDGKKVSFRELIRGKVVYLNFWGYT